MPSGYTAVIGERADITFPEFTKECARAFGAFVMERDNPTTGEIKFEKLDDHYIKNVDEANQAIADHQRKTVEDFYSEWMIGKYAQIDGYRDIIREKIELATRYKAMLRQVDRWIPPTIDHQGLKDFMIRQLNESIDWDCDTSYYDEYIKAAQEELNIYTHKQVFNEQLKELEESLTYYKKLLREETDRVNSRNEWKRQLIESL